MNRVILTGNIARDAELRGSDSGNAVLRFTIAVNERRRDANGNWSDVPSFFDCVLFGNRANSLANYLKKGTRCGVDGFLRQESWERDGKRQYAVRIIVDNFEFLGSRNGGNSNNQSYQQNNTSGYEQIPQNPQPQSMSNSQSQFGGDQSTQQYQQQTNTGNTGNYSNNMTFGQSGSATQENFVTSVPSAQPQAPQSAPAPQPSVAPAPAPVPNTGDSKSPIPF